MTLRPAGPADLPALMSLAESDAVRPFISFDAARRLRAALDAPGQELLVIETGGAFAGGARLVVRNARSRIGEVQTLMVAPAVRGQGVGAAALRALVALAFGQRGLHRLEGEVLGYNAAALRAFDAAGFTREGVRRRAYDREGAWQDSVLFGLLADER